MPGVVKKQRALLGDDPPSSILHKGDCLLWLQELDANYGEFVDLVYIDPPFNSGQTLRYPHGKVPEVAFDDTWGGYDYHESLRELRTMAYPGENYSGEMLAAFAKSYEDWFNNPPAASYLTAMATRLPWIRRVLKDTGTFYLHCDQTMSHPLKMLCDMIFGRQNFRNEIVWCYAGGGTPAIDFPRKYDSILRYTKGDKYTFNTERKPYKENTQMVGRHSTYSGGARINLNRGTPITDWWTDIKTATGWSQERVGYPTQKPLALVERIIKVSSNPGELVADFFCGCGTTIAAASDLNRKWIGCDISRNAIGIITQRLMEKHGIAEEVVLYSTGKSIRTRNGKKRGLVIDLGEPQTELEAKELFHHSWQEFERWIIEDLLHAQLNTQRPQRKGDGLFYYDKPKSARGVCLIEVKGGSANIGQVQAFAKIIELQKADIGVFVCFKKSGGMGGVADSMGFVPGTRAPRLQIITIAKLLAHQRPKLPYDDWPI